jgi:TRAP-type mannitol/chloroaromatic compound transport system substrate-binding protein
VAPFYYYPGWWEGGAMLHFFINKAKWESLPKNYQAVIRTAAARSNTDMQAKYDYVNPPALKKLVADGAKLRPFPTEVLEACFKAAKETYAELNATNAPFKKIHDAMMAYRADAYLWQQVSEATFDNFMMAQQRKKQL